MERDELEEMLEMADKMKKQNMLSMEEGRKAIEHRERILELNKY